LSIGVLSSVLRRYFMSQISWEIGEVRWISCMAERSICSVFQVELK